MPISVSNGLGKLVSANLTPNQRNIEESIQKLTTGVRIHKGADDAASMHLASKFESHVKGLTVTVSNQKDALSALYTAEGGINKIGDLLQKMRELAVQGSTGSVTTADRTALNSEVSALETEITRIGNSTTWGGINLLDGTYSKAKPIVFQIGPRSGNTLSFTMGYVNATAAAATQGTLGLTSDVLTATKASAYINVIDGAISIISTRRGSFGAVSNRLDSTIANLTNMKANIEAAKGQIVDTDFATETAKLARAQILMQAATAMLAQANASKNQTLKLIGG